MGTQVNLADNVLCGIYEDEDGDMVGTYTAEGIKAIAQSIAVSPSLTQLNARDNDIDRKGKAALRKAVKKRAGFELLL